MKVIYIKGVFMVNVIEGKTVVLKTKDLVTLIKSCQIGLPITLEPHIADKHPEAVQPKGVVLDAVGEVHKWPYPIK